MLIKKYICLFIVIWLIGLVNVNSCFPIDESGCLTCHKFPGLMAPDSNNNWVTLHIDEQKYLKSSHGKVSCKKCHTLIKKIPHTGDKKTSCFTNCHTDPDEKALISDYPLGNFHKKEQSHIIALDDKTSCKVCHSLYPHTHDHTVRAILNMHTGFMLCEVCHLKTDINKQIIYDWNNPEKVEFSGDPFGSFFKPKSVKKSQNINSIIRIGVFTLNKGKKNLIINTIDIPKAQTFKLKEKELTPDARQKELSYLHRDIEKKEKSIACEGCHSSPSVINFKSLGFSEQKAKILTDLDIKGLVKKYEIFYMPDLFGF